MKPKKKEQKEESVINKPSAMVQVTNRDLSLVQRKVFNALIFHAYPQIMQEFQEIDLSVIKKAINYKDTEALKEDILALMHTIVDFNIIGDRDKRIWKAYAILPYAEIRDDKVIYSFGPFRHEIAKPEYYARISLAIQRKFKSKYTLALYEFCCDHYLRQKGFGMTPWLPVEDLKELLGYHRPTETKYFQAFVLKKSVKEINEKSDIRVTVKVKRHKRQIDMYQFVIAPSPDNLVLKMFKPEQQELQFEGNTLYHRLVNEFQVNELYAKEIIRTYKPEHIEDCLFYISKRKDKIKDLGAYTYYLITNQRVSVLSIPDRKKGGEEIEIPEGARVEISGKEYTYQDGFVRADQGIIPKSMLVKMIREGKAKIVL